MFFPNHIPALLAQPEYDTPVHNFSIGTLTSYFGLEQAVCTFFSNAVLEIDGLPGAARKKVYVFDDLQGDPGLLAFIKGLQAQSVIYSLKPLPLPKGGTFHELAYNLDAVFDKASYPNAKKRAQRLQQPFKQLARDGVVIRSARQSDLPGINELHKDWVNFKMAQPATFKMMFPKRRYMNCIRIALERPKDYVVIVASYADRIVGARALFLRSGRAFDLACFSATWDMYSNFSEHFAIAAMRALHQTGIHTLNCGASLHKQLSAYKTHWPHYSVESFAYSKL